MEESKWISMSKAQELVGKHRQSIINPIKAGKINGHQSAHTWLIEKESLLAYFRSRAKNQVLDGFTVFCKYAEAAEVEALLAELRMMWWGGGE